MKTTFTIYPVTAALLGLCICLPAYAGGAGEITGLTGERTEIRCDGADTGYNMDALKVACGKEDYCKTRAKRWGTPFVFALEENERGRVFFHLDGKPCRTTATGLKVVGGPAPDTLEGPGVCKDHGSLGARRCKMATN